MSACSTSTRSKTPSPRAKAVVMRDLAAGTLDPQQLTSEPLKELPDLCFNCKQCQLECPSQVNIPQLMIEAKASHVAAQRAHAGRLEPLAGPFVQPVGLPDRSGLELGAQQLASRGG